MRRVFVAALLAVCLGAPIAEMFDRWDHTLQDGNDAEANLVVVVICVGIGFVAATAGLRNLRPSLTGTFRPRASSSRLLDPILEYLLVCFDASSPPDALRI